MTSYKASIYLNHLSKLPEYKKIFSLVDQLHANQLVFSNVVSPHLAKYCSLGQISNGKLTIMVVYGAVASKLKQMTPSLLSKLNELGWEVTSIQIFVQAHFYIENKNLLASKERANNKIELSATGKKCLIQLAATLPDSELKSTIQSFVKKHSID